MSKSYRKHPFISLTCAGYRRGEKKDKTIWHQQSRSKIRRILRLIRSYEEALDIPNLPHKNDVEIWTWTKDGKCRVNPKVSVYMYWTKDGYLKK